MERKNRVKRDINALISELTLEEKAGLCSGKDTWRLKAIERLGIPSVMVSDGPHGLRKQGGASDHLGLNDSIKAICFPAACAAAASFDEELLEKLGDMLGRECRAEDVAVLLGPAMNIKRSPLCGRNFEYFSEDPYLTGKLAAAQIRGIQRHDVGACAKHFAANNQEYRRMTCSSELDEKTLREIYLRAFEIAVREAEPWSVMSSYNKMNGTYVGESHDLLTKILREEWGFDGFVISDWGAVNDRVLSAEAGLDLEMPYYDGSGDRELAEAVRSGRLDEKLLDKAVERILKIVFRYYDSACEKEKFDREKHHEAAVQVAKKCAVLMKNNGLLPLDRGEKIAYIGPFAKAPRYQGGGSSHINAYRVTGAFDAAQSDNIIYSDGFSAGGEALSEREIIEAVQTAKKAQAAVIFAGLPDSYESEGYDRRHMKLPGAQNELIEKIAAVQPNTVVVLHIGSPVEMPWADNVAAILNMYLGGEGVGEAADALLYGDAEPAGRLPESFPERLEDTPCYLDFPGDGEKSVYSEGRYVGYRYYDAKNMNVLFPFGHGLSYTEFELSDMKISSADPFCVTVTVTNVGERTGIETVQIYVSAPDEKCKRLVGFKKICLDAGESKTVRIDLDDRAYEQFSEKLVRWYCRGGEFTVHAGHSSRDIRLTEKIILEANGVIPLTVDQNTTIAELFAHPATRLAVEKMLAAFRAAVSGGNADRRSEQEAVMMREMALNAPLRALPTFKLITTEQANALIGQMNALINEYNQKRE